MVKPLLSCMVTVSFFYCLREVFVIIEFIILTFIFNLSKVALKSP
jgi:hypothetical protein